jgi:hypothetical protein
MPNGDLFSTHTTESAEDDADDFSVPSPIRDMMRSGVFGHSLMGKTKTVWHPAIFETRQAAEKQLQALHEHASHLGITAWAGTVVERLCTPFITNDPAVEFRDDVISWIERQHGGAS